MTSKSQIKTPQDSTHTNTATDQAECPACLNNEATPNDIGVPGLTNQPTRWWHCHQCGAHLDRYRGQGDQTCRCGAEYNAFGQRLRDDWRSDPD